MNIDFITRPILESNDKTCIIAPEGRYTFKQIYDEYIKARDLIRQEGIKPHSVVALVADYSAKSIAMFVALIEIDSILVPIAKSIINKQLYVDVTQTEYYIDMSENDVPSIRKTGIVADHPMLVDLKQAGDPGLILLSSGTTGTPKAALHNMAKLLEKFKNPGKTLVTITFLLFDHIGGFNTMMHTLTHGGTIVTLKDRSPEEVCRLIEKEKVELLPTSPTFLNMILLNKLLDKYDLSSLKIISYGTEPMPESTLKALAEKLPNTRLKQTYGLSEVGIMATKSESSTSLWMKIGGDGFETKIVDDILYIRAQSAMIGYLNAPSPFDEEGWFCTKDKVEQKDGYIHILGRVTDLINVGGEKVYPIEIESALLEYPGVLEAHVYAEDNPLTGKSIVADIEVAPENNNRDFIKQLRKFSLGRLEKFKRPVKYNLTTDTLSGERFKKKR